MHDTVDSRSHTENGVRTHMHMLTDDALHKCTADATYPLH